MNCQRCNGLCVEDWVLAYDAEERSTTCWKCMNCGQVTDQTILANRREQRWKMQHEQN